MEDFPVRPDDDELLVEEFEMLELQPRAHARTAKPHPPPRDARPRDHATRTGRKTVHLLDYCNDPTTGEGSSASSTAAKAATTSPARCAPRLPQRSFSARDDLRHAPVDPHLGVM